MLIMTMWVSIILVTMKSKLLIHMSVCAEDLIREYDTPCKLKLSEFSNCKLPVDVWCDTGTLFNLCVNEIKGQVVTQSKCVTIL